MKKTLTWMDALSWANDHVGKAFDIIRPTKTLEHATVAGYILRNARPGLWTGSIQETPADGIVLMRAAEDVRRELSAVCFSQSYLTDTSIKEANFYREVRVLDHSISWDEVSLFVVSSLDSLKARTRNSKALPHYPGSCPSCGSPAYIGINIDCSKSDCRHKTTRPGQTYGQR